MPCRAGAIAQGDGRAAKHAGQYRVRRPVRPPCPGICWSWRSRPLHVFGTVRQGAAGEGVSVSPAWLKEPRLIERLCELLERSGIAADLVTLQVQDIALLSPQQRRESLERLHRLGCRLALGDFGCTAISLQGLLELPFCELIIAAPAGDACQAAVLAAGTGGSRADGYERGDVERPAVS